MVVVNGGTNPRESLFRYQRAEAVDVGKMMVVDGGLEPRGLHLDISSLVSRRG